MSETTSFRLTFDVKMGGDQSGLSADALRSRIFPRGVRSDVQVFNQKVTNLKVVTSEPNSKRTKVLRNVKFLRELLDKALKTVNDPPRIRIAKQNGSDDPNEPTVDLILVHGNGGRVAGGPNVFVRMKGQKVELWAALLGCSSYLSQLKKTTYDLADPDSFKRLALKIKQIFDDFKKRYKRRWGWEMG